MANAIGLYIYLVPSGNLYTSARLYSSNARNRRPLIDKGISLRGDRIAYLPTCIESETEEDLRVRRRRRNATRGETRCCCVPGVAPGSQCARCYGFRAMHVAVLHRGRITGYTVSGEHPARAVRRDAGARARARAGAGAGGRGDSLPLSTTRDTFAR